MQGDKKRQEVSILGRLLSLEALLLLMGVISFGYGLASSRIWNIIIGAAILVAALLLARKWRRGGA